LLAELIMVFTLLISIFFGIIPSAKDSYSFIAGVFYLPDFISLLFVPLGIFFLGSDLERKAGALHLGIIYLLAVISSMLFSGETAPALSGIDAIIGALIALDPFAMTIVDFIPIPILFAAVFLIATKLIFATSASIVPLLLGLAYGYFIKSFFIRDAAVQPSWQKYQ